MDVLTCVRTRRTVRSFKPDAVPDDIVERVLQAARWAPSSRNQQPWHLIVVRSPETLRKLGSIAASGRFIADSTVAIAMAMEASDRADLDAGRALQQMELVAWSEGLGTCFVGVRDPHQNREIKTLLGIPDAMALITVMPFGYRPDDFQGKGVPRKPLSDMVHVETFGNPYAAGTSGTL